MKIEKPSVVRRSKRHSDTALLLLSGALLIPAQAVHAQSASSASNDIVVRALKPEAESRIDRKIYRIESDLQSFTGSAADVLNKVPSVDVDNDGQISLRGDSNVTVLIDGRPSAQSSGSEALAQILAKDIEKIEIITNPPAEYKANGSGGVINIVTKKSRSPGLSGSAQANLGNDDRYQLGLSGSYKKDKLTLSGGLNLKQETRERDTTQRRLLLDPLSNTFAVNDQTTHEDTRRVTPSVKFGADYKLGKSETIGASFSHAERRGDRDSFQHNEVRDALGALQTDSIRTGDGKEWRLDSAEGLHYERRLATSNDRLSLNLQQSARRQRDRFDYLTTYALLVQAPTGNRIGQNVDYVKTEFSADYELPFPSGATLKTGYNLEHDSNNYNYTGANINPLSGAVTIDPALTNMFRYGQTIHAIYGSYETTFWNLDALAGVRIEETEIETRLITGGVNAENSDLRAYPSLHLSKELSDSQKINASYSRRITRPEAQDLNPFIDSRDARNLKSGNPNLKPKDTQSFELGYEYEAKGFSYHATGYYRTNRNSITDVTQIISNDVVLVTRANLPSDNAGGIEFGLNGKLTKQLAYNLSGDVYYNEIDARPFGETGTKSNVSGNGKMSLDYKPNAADSMQISLNYTGEKLSAQGTIAPLTIVNFGYKHKFADDMSAVFTVSDVFDAQKLERRFDTPALHDEYERRQNGPVIFVGLVYTFGGKSKSKDNFNYDDSGAAS